MNERRGGADPVDDEFDAGYAPDEVVGRDGWPAVAEAELGEAVDARAVRRYTRDAAKARSGAGIGSLLSDVYYAVLIVGIGVAVAAGVAGRLRGSLPAVPAGGGVGISLPALVVVLLAALAAMVVSLAGRLGPVGAGGAEAAWWLSLPAQRRGLLHPALRRLPLVAALAGGVVVALLDAAILSDEAGRAVRAGATGALAGALLVLAMAVVQSLGVSRRTAALAGDILLVVAPLAGAGLVALGLRPTSLPVPGWPLVAVLAVLTVAGFWWVDSRLGRIRERSLRESGSVASQAVGAVVSLDSRELGRVLSDGAAPASRRRSSRLLTVRGPASALVTADLALVRRSVRRWVQLLLAMAIPVLATVVPQLSGQVPVMLAVLVGGYVAVSSGAEGARRAETAPILDRLLPLDATTVRRLRMVVPGLAATAWAVVAFVAVGIWLHAVPWFVVLGLVGVPAWAAAAVRASYRPAPDWGKSLVATPFGAIPAGVASVLARGPDIVVLGLLPTWISLVVGHVTTTLVIAQAVTSTIAVMVASSTSTKSFAERMMAMQEEAEKQRAAAGR